MVEVWLKLYPKNCCTCCAQDVLYILNTFYTSLDSFEKYLGNGVWQREFVKCTICIINLYQYFGRKYLCKVSQPRVGIRERKVSNVSSKMRQIDHTACVTVINLAQLLPVLAQFKTVLINLPIVLIVH